MIYCPSCGSKNEEGEILCGECGAKLKENERLRTGFAVRPAEPVKPAEPMKFVEAAAPERKPGPVESASPKTGNSAYRSGEWNEVDFSSGETKKFPIAPGAIIIIAVIAAVMLYGILTVVIESYKHRPTGITLETYTVDVELFDEEGKKESITKGRNLFDGDSVRTGNNGEAYLKLGAARSLKMLADSQMQVHKAEEATWITMKKGALFFCIDDPYRSTETLELEAGAVSVSMIEATGYMYYNGKDEARIWVMNGEVQIVIWDEESGEQLIETLTPGEYAFGVFGDSGISCTVDKAFLTDLPSAMVMEIAETPELLNRVSPDSGWNRQDIINLAEQYRQEKIQSTYIDVYYLLEMMDEKNS